MEEAPRQRSRTSTVVAVGFGAPRVPLPAKLLMSYLIVVATAAVPTFIYVRSELESDLLQLAEDRLRESAMRAASGLLGYRDHELVSRTRQISSVVPQRITLIAPTGDILFDSESLTRESHAQRPEVQQALLGKPVVEVAIARRVSHSTGHDCLYAATRLWDEGPVIRLVNRVDDFSAAAADLKTFARNIAALAISLSIGLSLLAAVLFMRPLQRVVAVTRAFASGDLSASADVTTDDEVGDASRALDQMALDIRRRLANAGSGDAVIAQLVEALPIPCIVIEPSGEPMALNGAARRALRLEGASAKRRVQQIATGGRFRRAVAEAEADGDPEPCVIVSDDGFRFEGSVHVLKRPGAPPLTVLLGHEDRDDDTVSALPTSTTVEPKPFPQVMQEARDKSRAQLQEASVMVEVDDEPGVMVADVDGRLSRALALAFEGCAKAIAGKEDVIAAAVHVEPTRVRIVLDAVPHKGFLEAVRPVICPLGGEVDVDDAEVRLWLPRA